MSLLSQTVFFNKLLLFIVDAPKLICKNSINYLNVFIYNMNYLRVILFLWAHVCYCLIYNILPKVLGHLLLINGFDYFSNFQEYKSYDAYNDILGNCVLLILLVWTEPFSILT